MVENMLLSAAESFHVPDVLSPKPKCDFLFGAFHIWASILTHAGYLANGKISVWQVSLKRLVYLQ